VQLFNEGTNLTMDVYYSETTPGAPLLVWTPTGNPNQAFELVPTGDSDGSVYIKPKHSGLCFDIYYSETTPDAPLIQWTCTGNPNQKFIFVPIGAYYLIKNVNSGLCLSSTPAASDGIQYVKQEPCNSALPAQLFLEK
jgi:hypothetical protein